MNAKEWFDEPGQRDGWYNDCYECGASVEVDYVGELCRRCGGLRHYARECPTPKGIGKGEQVKGKGNGKGKGKSGSGVGRGRSRRRRW